MTVSNVICPICGTRNNGVDLEETNGWMECEQCQNVVRIVDNPADSGGLWQVMHKLPCRE